MRGFPKHFATKQDYLNSLSMYPAETKAALKSLMADRYIWEQTKELADKSKGKEDSTHRILEQEKTDDDGNKTVVYMQLEKKEDSNARIFQLGFTVKEIEALI